MFGLLSEYWLDEHHADAEVLLATRTGDCDEHVLARVPIHCIVVASASKYFSTLLSPAWHTQGSKQMAPVKLVLGEPADFAAMVALLKCIYTGGLDVTIAEIGMTLLPDVDGCSWSSSILDYISCCCWQELHLHVIRLADKYAVHGAMTAAITKLTNLLSSQLTWPTIEAVLWMPPALVEAENMAALQQMAINGIKQKLGVLDSALLQRSGRQMLQALPAETLAAILSCDTLTVTSENTVLAAIEVWLGGPVANALARAEQDLQGHQCCCSGSGGSGCHACTTHITPSGTCSSTTSCSHLMLPGDGLQEAWPAGGACPLLAALSVLLSSVRLNQCSGPFLAAAVERMPWLCAVLQPRWQELQLLQQYYSSDSEGRYQLSMHLIQQNMSCPWHPTWRKALPSGFSTNRPGQWGTRTLLSEMRALLDTTPEQRGKQAVQLCRAVHSPSAPAPGVLLAECVMGRYCWRLSLVAVPFRSTRSSPAGSTAGDEAGVGGLPPSAAAAGVADGMQVPRQQLAVSVICRPAWAEDLDSFDSSRSRCSGPGSSSGRSHDSSTAASPISSGGSSLYHHGAANRTAAADVDTAAKAAAFQPADEGVPAEAGASAAALLAARCHGGSNARLTAFYGQAGSSGASATPTAAGSSNHTMSCRVCQALCSIAADKAAATAAHHLAPTHSSTDSSCRSPSAGWADAQDVIVGVAVVAAPTAAALQGLTQAAARQHPSESHTACRLRWCKAAGAVHGLVPLDVSDLGSTNNLVSSWDCSAEQLPEGAVQPTVRAAAAGGAAAAAAAGVAAGGGPLDGRVAGGLQQAAVAGERYGGGGSLAVGWQAELWSRLAFAGELHWQASLRLLSE